MNILVFQHLAVEHPGSMLDFWRAAGHTWVTVELDAGDLVPSFAGFDLLVVMGGPMDVWQEDQHPWLTAERAAIRSWVLDLGKPYLGICLGHQLLAVALDGEVGPMGRPEVGLSQVDLTTDGIADPLLAGFPQSVETFQWHGAEVSRIPAGAIVLAKNSACPVQAFRWGRVAYGFQYHVEITASTVSDWESIPEYKNSLEKALGAKRAGGLAAEVTPRLQAFRFSAQRLNENLRQLIASPAR